MERDYDVKSKEYRPFQIQIALAVMVGYS